MPEFLAEDGRPAIRGDQAHGDLLLRAADVNRREAEEPLLAGVVLLRLLTVVVGHHVVSRLVEDPVPDHLHVVAQLGA